MVEQITPDDLHARMTAGGVTLVDVREVHEFVAGHVPGAVNIPLALLPLRIHELPTDGTVHVICQSGNRSMTACTWLARNGRQSANVIGGTGMWIRTGRTVERGTPA